MNFASTASSDSDASIDSVDSTVSVESKASTVIAVEDDDMSDVDDIAPELSAAGKTMRKSQKKRNKENKSMYDKYWAQASKASGKNLSDWFSLFADARKLAEAMKEQLHANAKPLCGVFQPAGSAYSPTGVSYHNENTHDMLSVPHTQEFAFGEVSEPGQQLPQAQDKYTSTLVSPETLPEETRQLLIDALNDLYKGKNKGKKMLVGKSHMAKYRKNRKATKYHVKKAPLTPEQRKAKQERDKRHRALKKAKKEADKAEQAKKAKQDAEQLKQLKELARQNGWDLSSIVVA